MRKAFCTFGVGPYEQVLNISRPTFKKYCEIHRYDYIEQYPRIMGKIERPPSWGKIPLLLDLLEDYDFVVWSDCDAIIAKFDKDVEDAVPLEDIQAMVFENTPLGECPCCGFWCLRPEMIPYLEEAWKMEKYINHYWWEQRAIHDLMGYEANLKYLMTVPVRVRETELYHKTWVLPSEWNSFDFENLQNESRVIHFPMYDPHERAENMENWLNGKPIKSLQYRADEQRRNREARDSGQVRVPAI